MFSDPKLFYQMCCVSTVPTNDTQQMSSLGPVCFVLNVLNGNGNCEAADTATTLILRGLNLLVSIPACCTKQF